jgi:hypothetical protein
MGQSSSKTKKHGSTNITAKSKSVEKSPSTTKSTSTLPITTNSTTTIITNNNNNPITKQQPPTQFLAFMSHAQKDTGDWVQMIARQFKFYYNLDVWIDMDLIGNLDEKAMKTGISSSTFTFIVLSQGYIKSWFCGMECAFALTMKRPIVLLVETDIERGGISTNVDDALIQLLTLIQQKASEYVTGEFISELQHLNVKSFKSSVKAILPIQHTSIDFTTTILQACGINIKPLQSSIVSIPPKYLLLCDDIAQDQATVLVTSTTLFENIKGEVITSVSNLSTHPLLPVILFVTDSVLKHPLVIQCLEVIIKTPRRLVLVHENDGRRRGRTLGGNDQEWWSLVCNHASSHSTIRSLVESHISSSIPYGKDERSIGGRGTFFKDVLDALGLLNAPFDAEQSVLVLPGMVKDVAFESIHDWIAISQGDSLSTKGLVIHNATVEQLPAVYAALQSKIVAFTNALNSSPQSILRILPHNVFKIFMDLFVDLLIQKN